MNVVYTDYVKLLMFNFFNKSFVSIVYISFSPPVILPCNRSIAAFVSRFTGSAIQSLFYFSFK